jgi:hypothetical protein
MRTSPWSRQVAVEKVDQEGNIRGLNGFGGFERGKQVDKEMEAI